MMKWCKKNKIKINIDKTHVLFNEYHRNDNITVGEKSSKLPKRSDTWEPSYRQIMQATIPPF